MSVDLIRLREAIEASWGTDTSYGAVSEKDNPSLGQCYVTSRVVQAYFPEYQIVEGRVRTGSRTEKHFWNVLQTEENDYYLDLTWQQFPAGSNVTSYAIRHRETYNDSEQTVLRVEILMDRVDQYLRTLNS